MYAGANMGHPSTAVRKRNPLVYGDLRGRKHDGRLACEEAKGEGLLKIKANGRVRVREITDGDILPEVEFEIATSRGQDKGTLNGWSPDDVAVDNALDVFQDRVAVIAGFRELR